MGRKRTSPDERRSVAVTILLKPAEARELRQAAANSRTSVSSCARVMIKAGLRARAFLADVPNVKPYVRGESPVPGILKELRERAKEEL